MEIQNISLNDIMQELIIIKQNQEKINKNINILVNDDLIIREDYLKKLNKIEKGKHYSFSNMEEFDDLIENV